MRRETKGKSLMIILGIAFLLNITAINLFPSNIEELVLVGWIVFGVGAFLYGLTILTLRKKGVGNVVDRGVYGVVRHPMYLGAMIMFLSHVFLGQNWIVAIGTVVAIVCTYLISLSDEERNLEKFGDNYKRYMQKVPRINFVVGAIRLLRRRLPTHESCANFENGLCKLNNVTVNPKGIACSKFTPKRREAGTKITNIDSENQKQPSNVKSVPQRVQSRNK